MSAVPARLTLVENRVEAVEKATEANGEAIAEIKKDTARVRELLEYADGVRGLFRKYGKRAILFGAGAFTTLGIGNQDFWRFVSTFFGG